MTGCLQQRRLPVRTWISLFALQWDARVYCFFIQKWLDIELERFASHQNEHLTKYSFRWDLNVAQLPRLQHIPRKSPRSLVSLVVIEVFLTVSSLFDSAPSTGLSREPSDAAKPSKNLKNPIQMQFLFLLAKWAMVVLCAGHQQAEMLCRKK